MASVRGFGQPDDAADGVEQGGAVGRVVVGRRAEASPGMVE